MRGNRSLWGTPRAVYGRVRSWRSLRADRGFSSRLRFDPLAPALLLSPHLDDAVLNCWGLLANETPLQVVNIFAGVPQINRLTRWDEITGASESAARVHERLHEDGLALACAAREPVNLQFLDAQYRDPLQPPKMSELDRALCVRVQNVSHVYAPAGIGAHPDHVLTRRYARLLCGMGVPVSLYAELPYCVRHGWPDWVVSSSESDRFRNVDAFWHEFLAGVPNMPDLRAARVERLEDASAAAKLQAMMCYQSQIPALDFGAKGVLTDPSIYRYEVRWTLL